MKSAHDFLFESYRALQALESITEDDTKECPECQGDGIVDDGDDTKECPECQGDGIVDESLGEAEPGRPRKGKEAERRRMTKIAQNMQAVKRGEEPPHQRKKSGDEPVTSVPLDKLKPRKESKTFGGNRRNRRTMNESMSYTVSVSDSGESTMSLEASGMHADELRQMVANAGVSAPADPGFDAEPVPATGANMMPSDMDAMDAEPMDEPEMDPMDAEPEMGADPEMTDSRFMESDEYGEWVTDHDIAEQLPDDVADDWYEVLMGVPESHWVRIANEFLEPYGIQVKNYKAGDDSFEWLLDNDLEEFANSAEDPDDPMYGDAEQQLISQSGGLNREKRQYRFAKDGDNPMRVRESLERKWKKFSK